MGTHCAKKTPTGALYGLCSEWLTCGSRLSYQIAQQPRAQYVAKKGGRGDRGDLA